MKTKLLHIVTFIALLSFPNVNFGQMPNLGTAFNFALFTAAGAFDNVGTATYVTGNVGTNKGAFNAFPTGTLVGESYVVNAISAQAATDVDIAYSYLSSLTCDSTIGTTLGNGQSLTSNVYCLGAASTLNGSLILDGQGNSDALFIFKIDGALSTSAFSNIILINSASLNNIYWQINGAFESGDSSVFRGNIIANGAITLLERSSLFGRGLSRAGAISLHNNNITLISPSLPIELLSFDAKPNNDFINLTWSTLSEINNDYFTIEKTKDGISYETIKIIGGAGNSNTLLNYSSEDNKPFSGVSYYRLKQTDFDGKFTYSNLMEVDFEKPFDVNIYPNPFYTSITIMINEGSQIDKAEFRIYNASGVEVINTLVTTQVTNLDTKNLPSGIYSYKLIDENKIIQSGKLVSQ